VSCTTLRIGGTYITLPGTLEQVAWALMVAAAEALAQAEDAASKEKE
jgi:hypothetical protein